MSISKIRDMFDKKGCQVGLGILGLLFIIGLLNGGTCRGLNMANQGQNPSAASSVVAMVGDQPVTIEAIEQQEDLIRKQQNIPPGDPQADFYLTSRGLEQTIRDNAMSILASKLKVEATPEALTALIQKQKPQLIQYFREKLVSDKKLKEGASDADFIKAYKDANNGLTPEEGYSKVLKDRLSEIADKDPVKANLAKKQMLGYLLTDRYEQKTTVTLDQLKESYTNIKVKQMIFADPAVKPEEQKARADKAYAELKAGAKFDDMIKKYTPKGSNTVFPMLKKTIQESVKLKFLLDLKPGQFSDVKMERDTPFIYQFISSGADLPPDFEKNKDRLLVGYKSQLAQEQLNKDIDEIVKGKDLVFKDETFRVAHELVLLQTDAQKQKIDSDQLTTQLKAIVDKSKSLPSDAPMDKKLKSLIRYVSFEGYYGTLKDVDKKALRKDRSEVLSEIYDYSPTNAIALDLYDNLIEQEDYEEAGNILVKAASNNVGTDPTSIAANSAIEDRVTKAEKAGKVNKDSIALAKKELERWKKDRIEDDKQRAADEKEAKESAAKADKELEKLNDPAAVKKNDAVPVPPKK